MQKQLPILGITRSNQYQAHTQVDKVKSHFIQSAKDNIGDLYDLHRLKSGIEHVELINSLLADDKYMFPIAESVEGGVRGPNPMQRESKVANKWLGYTRLPGGCNPAVCLHQILSSAE